MAINAYTGLMGGGKSYEVVASVIVPAFSHGRRIVTNVDGINEEAIRAHLVAQKKDADKFGEIVHVTNDDVMGHGFFPDEDEPDRESIVKAGDLLCIDEAWRFWGKDKKGGLPPLHMKFFRMHRHYVHADTGTACDVALIVQDIGDLHSSLRAVVEMTAVMTKLKILGLTRSYRVDLYEGGRKVKTAKFETYVKNYDKRIFPLYQSYAGGQGKEKAIDKRQNVLKNPRVWIIGLATVLLLGVSLYGVWWFLKGRMVAAPKQETKQATDGGRVLSAPPPAPVGSGDLNAPLAGRSGGSDGPLRVAGEVYVGWKRYVVVIDPYGRARFESPEWFVGSGIMLQGEVNGQRITTWSGPPPQQSSMLGGGK